MAAKKSAGQAKAKAAKAKSCPLGIAPEATFTEVLDELGRFTGTSAMELGHLARFEATARRAERAAELCRRALASTEQLRRWVFAGAVTGAIDALARAGGHEALVAALVEAAFALVKEGDADESFHDRQSRLASWFDLGVAAVGAKLAARGTELIDGALSALPAGLEGVDSPLVAKAAGALLAVGDLARARQALARRSHDLRFPLEACAHRGDLEGLKLLLEFCSDYDTRDAAELSARRGRADLVELLLPRLAKTEPMAASVVEARLAARGDAATWASLLTRSFATSVQAGTVVGATLVDAVGPSKLPELLPPLEAALRAAPFADFQPWWRCLGALAAGGRDVGELVSRASGHPGPLLEALSHGAAHRDAVAALAEEVTGGTGPEFARVAAGLLRAGHAEASAGFLEKALEAAGSDRFKCVDVALELAAVNSAEGVWSALKQVSKARRINALEDLISAVGQRGQFALVLGLLRTEPTLAWNTAFQAGFGCSLAFERLQR